MRPRDLALAKRTNALMSSYSGEVSVVVPATTANLGPGFDSVGLCLDLVDQVSLRPRESGSSDIIDVVGAGADSVPRDESNLVLGTIKQLYRDVGFDLGPLHLRCVNRIPHGMGLGSSAAAIVGALLVGKELARVSGCDVNNIDVFQIASDMEGHPDNVAPCLFGGMSVSWDERGVWEVAQLRPHEQITACLAVPDSALSTKAARELIPASVSHRDAVRNTARAALLIHAFTTDPTLLFPATQDFLHQRYRESAYPHSYKLVSLLRDRGVAAAISGAGPTVIAFGTAELAGSMHEAVARSAGHFQVVQTAINNRGAFVV